MRIRSFAAIAVIAAAASCGSDKPTGTAPAVATIIIADIRTLLNPGMSLQLAVFAFNQNGELIVNPGTFVWTSSAPSVATVSQVGIVTSLAAGSTTISAALGGATGTMNVVISAPTPATKDTIVTLPNTFSPNIVTIKAGQSVTFLFAGDVHNVIFNPANPPGSPADILDTKNLAFTRTFNAKGTFGYDCRIHPGMSGQVVVQ